MQAVTHDPQSAPLSFSSLVSVTSTPAANLSCHPIQGQGALTQDAFPRTPRVSATCPSKIGYPRSSRTCTSHRVSSSLFSFSPSLMHSLMSICLLALYNTRKQLSTSWPDSCSRPGCRGCCSRCCSTPGCRRRRRRRGRRPGRQQERRRRTRKEPGPRGRERCSGESCRPGPLGVGHRHRCTGAPVFK